MTKITQHTAVRAAYSLSYLPRTQENLRFLQQPSMYLKILHIPSFTLRLPQANLPLFFQPSLSHHVLEIIVLVLQNLSKVQSIQTDSTLHLRPSMPDFADWNTAYTSEFALFLQQQHTETYPELISKRKKLISL